MCIHQHPADRIRSPMAMIDRRHTETHPYTIGKNERSERRRRKKESK